MNCKNCDTKLTGKYCTQCGQSANVKRITLPKLLSEISESIFQFDRGLLFTFKQLFTRPGLSIRAYLDGKRKNHFKPFAYLLLFSTLYFFISKIMLENTWLDDIVSGFTQGANDLDNKTELPGIIKWFGQNYAYATLLLIPIFSLATFISFSKKDTNYLEHLVLNAYITGHQAIFYCIFSFINPYLGEGYFEMIPFLISISYCGFVLFQFFASGNRFVNILRTILSYVIYLVISSVILLFIFKIVGFD